jgi:tRNA pseudouridine38-40 synthase
MRLRFTVAYDGRPFRGWQRQGDESTVQGHLEAALRAVVGAPVAVCGSGRTDAGVHALGQCAHVAVDPHRLAPARWVAALNAHLPGEIRVLRAAPAPDSFHARRSACAKFYRYRIWNGDILPPHELGRAWHVQSRLDLDAMRRGAVEMTGRRDFGAFAANRGRPEKSTVRHMRRITVARRGRLVTVSFECEGFLYRMARLLTGALVRCGRGTMSPEEIRRHVERGAAGGKCSYCAPAHGLYLVRVAYG